MQSLKRPLTFFAISCIAISGLCIGLAPARADDSAVQAETKPVTYEVRYQCQSGQFARVVTHDQKLSETIEQLSKGAVTPAQVLDYVNNNVTKELDKTIVFLDVCVGVKFRRT